MAAGMKAWLGLIAAGMAATALLGLPPREAPFRPTETNAREALARDLDREVRRLDRTLGRVRVQDSLRAVLAGRPEAATGVVTGSFATVDGWPALHAVRRRLLMDEAALPERTEDVLLGGFWVSSLQGSHLQDAVREPRGARTEWYGGELADGRSYCMVVTFVHPERRGHLAGPTPPATHLGPCAWWARFGPAGPSVRRWLARGGATLTTGRRATGGRPAGREVDGRGRPVLDPYRHLNEPLLRCLEGETDVCAGLVLSGPGALGRPAPADGTAREAAVAEDEERARVPGYLGRWGYTPLRTTGSRLLADLEAEFGSDALRAFWTSGEPVDRAFRAAFGVEVGTWARAWISGYHPNAVREGNALPRPLNALSVLALLALVAVTVGYGSARRRLG